MNLIEINAAKLSNKKCWQITRTTLRVDPRCRQQSLLDRYADDLYDQLQAMKAEYEENPHHFMLSLHKHRGAIYALMLPFLRTSYMTGYRDMVSTLGIKPNATTINVLSASATARAGFSADTMTKTTVERLQEANKRDAEDVQDTIDDIDDIDDDHGIDKIDDDEPDEQLPDDPKDTRESALDDEDIADDAEVADPVVEESWVFSRARARAATDFEGVKGYQTGSEAGIRQDGKWLKVWMVDPNSHDRDDECDDNEDDGPIPLGQEFSSGDQTVPAHPNCVCSIYYVRP